MTINDSETNAKRYTLRPTYTPLPQAKGNSAKTNIAADTHESSGKKTNSPNNVIRAANEDDDLYDPYSDYHDGTLKAAEFEKDPWR